MAERTFTVATFGRVFDVTPTQDALTFAELAAALTRFQLKPALAQREARQLERLHEAADTQTGPIWKRLERIMADDQVPLVRALDKLEREILRAAKTDLRLWAPILFAAGATREDASVVHLSALVFDFDGALALRWAREAFQRYVHIGHTTWSHSDTTPKLRIILPFEAPIAPADYDAVWHFGNDLTGGLADPTGRALARAWALPAVRDAEQARAAWVHAADHAAFFDPIREGLAAASPHPTPAPTGACLMRPDPSEAYVSANGPDGTEATEPSPAGAAGGTFDPWDGGAPPAPSPRARATPESPAGPASADDAVLARLAKIEARLAALERVLADYL
jgi:hypothetical protein